MHTQKLALFLEMMLQSDVRRGDLSNIDWNFFVGTHRISVLDGSDELKSDIFVYLIRCTIEVDFLIDSKIMGKKSKWFDYFNNIVN